mgnify:CR=1 FL=1
MEDPINKIGGYVCAPYLHNHDSIELKDLWISSRNITSLFFVTATFSEDTKPYFSSPLRVNVKVFFSSFHFIVRND